MFLQWLSNWSNSHNAPQNKTSQDRYNYCCPGRYTLYQALTDHSSPRHSFFIFMTEAQTLWEDTVTTLMICRHHCFLRNRRLQTAGSISEKWNEKQVNVCDSALVQQQCWGSGRWDCLAVQMWGARTESPAPTRRWALPGHLQHLCQLSDTFAKYWEVGGHHSLATVRT